MSTGVGLTQLFLLEPSRWNRQRRGLRPREIRISAIRIWTHPRWKPRIFGRPAAGFLKRRCDPVMRRPMMKKKRRAHRGRQRISVPALFILAAIGLIVAGQPGPALDVLAQGGIDFRGIMTSINPERGDHPPRAVAPETAGIDPQAYDRDSYGGWIDESGNCHNTRAEILTVSSTGPVHMRDNGCIVDRGKWFDPYTGKTFTDASDLDIDHLVPLAWAHARGASAWPDERKREFANWQVNLVPVQSSINREKGARGPDKWLPPRVEYRCEYLLRFERVVRIWDLQYFPEEAETAAEIKAHYCPTR